ncbi:MAG: hypothetical protein M3Y26_04110 [Actinomycetota bacterium]|nr:hypothetical protein [Actinomycetota bacterium]
MCIIAPEPDSIDRPISGARQALGAAAAGGVLASVPAAVGDDVLEEVAELGDGGAVLVAVAVAVTVAVGSGAGVELLQPASSPRAVTPAGTNQRLSIPPR